MKNFKQMQIETYNVNYHNYFIISYTKKPNDIDHVSLKCMFKYHAHEKCHNNNKPPLLKNEAILWVFQWFNTIPAHGNYIFV